MCLKNGARSFTQRLEPILDLELAVQNLAGDMNLYLEVVGYFFESAPSLINYLFREETQSKEDIRRCAHSLKSASRAVGAMRLGALAEFVEKNGFEQEKGALLGKQLVSEIIQFKNALTNHNVYLKPSCSRFV